MKAMNAMKSWFKSTVALVALTFGFAANAAVCKIGETPYDTLAAAVTAAQSGDTITMLANSSATSVVAAGKAITIDLKGFVIDGTIEYKGDLTLTDSVGTGYIRTMTDHALTGTGNLVLGANIGASNARSMGVYATNGKVTIATDIKIYTYDDGIWCEGADLTITGEPTVDSSEDGYAALNICGESTVSIAGGTYLGDMVLWGDGEGQNVIVTGGKFKSRYTGNDSVFFFGSDCTVAISGGIYADDSAKNYLASGCKVVDNPDSATKGTYPYAVVPPPEPVAKIGDKTYTDLATALSEVQSGETVEILKGGSYPVQTLVGTGYTVDASGADGAVTFTRTAEYQSRIVSENDKDATGGGAVTVKNVIWNLGCAGYQYFAGANCIGCTFYGTFCTHTYNRFEGCTFYAPGYTGDTTSAVQSTDYSAWCYFGKTDFTGCHFYGNGKFFNVYNEGINTPYDLSFSGCDFHSSKANKAAVNIKETGNSQDLKYNVTISDCTTDENFPAGTAFDASNPLWVASPLAQIDDRNTTTAGYKTGIKLAIDGTQVYPELNFYQDAQNPNLWHIRNLAGLKEFRASCINEVNYEKKTVRLDADIDLGNEEWTPIPATYAQDDTAVFDGNGKTISNLKVTASGKSAGLFAQAIGWTIKDLAIDGASVSGIGWCGAIVGYGSCVCVDGCTVKNASVTSNVANNDDGDKAGAIVGYLSAENTAWIKNCAVLNCTIKGYRDIGGVTGYANGASEVSGCTVKDTTVVNDKSVNYKGYTTDEQYNVHEVVGNKASDATVKDNTVTNVEVVQPKMVAKIGFKEYETLQAALAAAQKDDTVELLADIDLEGAAWTPVTFNYKTFDGKGHKISNFTVTGEKAVGFFGNADCSTIKNLTIENATVNGINHVGAVAGRGLCTKIENCTAKNCSVTTSVKNNDDGDKAGGICGYLSGEPNAWVKDCLVTGCTITGYRDIGGAVGIANQTAEVSGTTVKDTTIVNDRSNNYKNYTKNAEFDIHEIVGEVTPTASVTGNTADNVKILGMVYAVQIGDKGYEALEDAVGAVQNGETILLLANNAEVFTAGTTALFVIDPTNFTFTASNVTPLDGCELVGNLDGTYTYRMKVVVKDQITKNVVETKVEDEVVAAAVAITDDNFGTIFKETGSKELEVVASGVGTVSFNSAAVDQIGANMKTVIAAVGGEEETATTKTTLTVAIADVTEEVKEEKPEIIITEQGNLEVVQAISVTAIMRTIVQQAGSSETVSTNDEVFAQGKTIAACVSTVTIPYSGIAPQVWYVDTTVAPWTTNAMDTAYNADTKELSFAVAHFSDYVITDAETYAMVGAEKFRTLQEAFDWVEADQTQGTTITLTKTNTLTSAATFGGALATLNLNGKAVVGSIAAGAGSILTVTNGTIDAGSAVFASGDATAKIYLVGGTYLGQFPDPSGLATNAGPLLISGGKFEHEIPWAYCAPGYEPNPTPVGGFYTVKNAKIYIRDISACQRYPWNGYVDITLDVCWDDEVKAKLYASAWDLAGATPAPIAMKNATLLEEGVSGSRSVNCEKGFEVTAPEKKTLHLIWNSADEGVPTGTKRERVGFKFMSKRVNAN